MSHARSKAGVRRRLCLLALSVFVAVGGTACVAGVPPTACPAIGYSSTLKVVLTGTPPSDIAHVEVCAEDGCDADAMTRSPSPTAPIYTVTEVDSEHWEVVFFSGVPSAVTVAAFSADWNTLGEATSELEWRRVGGTEACGGPQEAGPIVIQLG